MKYFLALAVILLSFSGCTYWANPRQEAFDRAQMYEMNQDFVNAQRIRSTAYSLPERERRHYIPIIQRPAKQKNAIQPAQFKNPSYDNRKKEPNDEKPYENNNK